MATSARKRHRRTPKDGSAYELDRLDYEIMRHLRRDPQTSNKLIAQSANVSEMTIANRINALIANKLIKITVQRDIRTLGYDIYAIVEVYVEGRDATKVGAALGAIPEVQAAVIVMGSPEIILTVIAKSILHLANVLENSIGTTPGVARTVSSLSLDMIKASPGIAAI